MYYRLWFGIIRGLDLNSILIEDSVRTLNIYLGKRCGIFCKKGMVLNLTPRGVRIEGGIFMFVCVPPVSSGHGLPSPLDERRWHVLEVLSLKIEPSEVLRPCQVPETSVLVAYTKEPGIRPPYEKRRFVLAEGPSKLVERFKFLIEKDDRGYDSKEKYYAFLNEAGLLPLTSSV